MPMVEAGCENYQEQYKLPGVTEEIYTDELKEMICRRIAETCIDLIKDGQYDPKEV